MSTKDRANTAGQAQDETTDTRTAEEIEADLARTRADLADSLEAVGAKLDVKARSRSWAQDKKARAQRQARGLREQHGREIAVAAGVAVSVTVVLLVWRRRH